VLVSDACKSAAPWKKCSWGITAPAYVCFRHRAGRRLPLRPPEACRAVARLPFRAYRSFVPCGKLVAFLKIQFGYASLQPTTTTQNHLASCFKATILIDNSAQSPGKNMLFTTSKPSCFYALKNHALPIQPNLIKPILSLLLFFKNAGWLFRMKNVQKENLPKSDIIVWVASGIPAEKLKRIETGSASWTTKGNIPYMKMHSRKVRISIPS